MSGGIRLFDCGDGYLIYLKHDKDIKKVGYGAFLRQLALINEKDTSEEIKYKVEDADLPVGDSLRDELRWQDIFDVAGREDSYIMRYLGAIEKILLHDPVSKEEKKMLMPDNAKITYVPCNKVGLDMIEVNVSSLRDLVVVEAVNALVNHRKEFPKHGRCEVCGRIYLQEGRKDNSRKYCNYLSPQKTPCSGIARERKASQKREGLSEVEKFTKNVRERVLKQEKRNGWPIEVRHEMEQVTGNLTEIYQSDGDAEKFKENLQAWYKGKQKEFKAQKK